ncbi:MAG: M23 family metallopeptidase [Pseudomonadales bacterium]
MRIILVSGRGMTRTIDSRQVLTIGGACLAILVTAALTWQPSADMVRRSVAAFAPQLDRTVVRRWEAASANDRARFSELRAQVQAENDAAGKLLAQMEARLLRMEALGQRVVEVTAIDADEFDFSTLPATGGPDADNTIAVDELSSTDIRRQINSLAERLRTRETELTILESLLADNEQKAEQQPAGWPVAKGWISSPFGRRVDPITGKRAWHAGMDFAGKDRSNIVSVASGVVTYAGERDGYGRVTEITHGNGLLTRYAHQNQLLVATGDIVRKGQVIGLMGRTGRATGPHLHFEVEKDGKVVNPAQYLKRRS